MTAMSHGFCCSARSGLCAPSLPAHLSLRSYSVQFFDRSTHLPERPTLGPFWFAIFGSNRTSSFRFDRSSSGRQNQSRALPIGCTSAVVSVTRDGPPAHPVRLPETASAGHSPQRRHPHAVANGVLVHCAPLRAHRLPGTQCFRVPRAMWPGFVSLRRPINSPPHAGPMRRAKPTKPARRSLHLCRTLPLPMPQLRLRRDELRLSRSH